MESSGKRPTDTDRILLHKLVQEEGFSTPPAEIVDHILDRSTVVCLRSGEPLISLGFVNPDFYILLDGIIRRWHPDGNREVTSAFALAGTQSSITTHTCAKAAPATSRPAHPHD